MKAVVTGSNGFIGFNLCKALHKEQWQVIGIDDLSSGRKEHTIEGFQYYQIKIQEKDKVRRIFNDFQPDVIFHLAAVPRVSYSVEHPFDSAEANTLGLISLLEGVVKAGLSGKTRFVNTSSSSVYGGADLRPTSETHPCVPQSPYALEKYQGEQWCRMFATLYGLDVVSLRYFNVFGPHAMFGGAYSTVLSAWMYHLYVDSTYKPFLEDNGTQTRDFCFVDNVVQANILAATRQQKFTGEAFNIAQGHAVSLLDCKVLLEGISGRTLDLESRAPRVGDVKHTLADISYVQAELKYQPTTDFEEQVKQMAKWYKTSYPTSPE
jgi:UDP-glucose 4-epimerase